MSSTKTAEFNWELNFPVTTNSSGNAGWYIFADGISGTAANEVAFAYNLSDSTFAPATGDSSVAAFVAGPMATSAFSVARMNSMAVEFIPSESSNNN
jgi:hypothetical protein